MRTEIPFSASSFCEASVFLNGKWREPFKCLIEGHGVYKLPLTAGQVIVSTKNKDKTEFISVIRYEWNEVPRFRPKGLILKDGMIQILKTYRWNQYDWRSEHSCQNLKSKT